MTQLLDRYASAIRSSHLRSEAGRVTDVDVLGAAGIAAKRSALPMALARLFVGDARAADEIVGILSALLRDRSMHTAPDLKRTQADDIARAVLAWHRDGVCKPCGGHGYERIDGTPALSERECGACQGTGRRLFERQFRAAWRPHARWLLSVVEVEMSEAGPAAMRALAPSLEL